MINFPGGSGGKASAYNAGDLGSIPGSGRSPGEGNGNPLQYSCLENPMDRGAWWATVRGVAKSRTRLSDFTYLFKSMVFCYSSLNGLKLTSKCRETLKNFCLARKKSKRTGVGCHFLLQGIFLTQGLNPGLPHCRQTLYHLSHQGSPRNLTGMP